MFSSRSHAPPQSPHTLNALAPTAEPARKARHLAMAQELAELGMGLARSAAARATTLFAEEAAAPPPDPAEAPEPPPVTAAVPLTPAQSHAFTFARLSNAIRQAIALEARIAADAFAPRPAAAARAPAQPRRPDARRALLRQALHEAAATEPDPALLRRAIDARIEDELQADPDVTTPVWELLESISADMALTLNLPRLPDACLPPAPDDEPPFDIDEFRMLIQADWQSRAPP